MGNLLTALALVGLFWAERPEGVWLPATEDAVETILLRRITLPDQTTILVYAKTQITISSPAMGRAMAEIRLVIDGQVVDRAYIGSESHSPGTSTYPVSLIQAVALSPGEHSVRLDLRRYQTPPEVGVIAAHSRLGVGRL